LGEVRVVSVWPGDGVAPANTRVVVEYEGLALFAEHSIAMRDVSVVDAGGVAVAGTVRLVAGGRAGRTLAVLELAEGLVVGGEYQVRVRIGMAGGILASPMTVARFGVGAADGVAPAFGGVTRAGQGAELERCDSSACCGPYVARRVTFEWQGAGEVARYNVYRVGDVAPVQPLVVMGGGLVECGGTLEGGQSFPDGDYFVRAVDLAGNEDGNDVRMHLAVDCGAGSGGGGGCAVAARGRGWVPVFLLGFLLVITLVRARRRVLDGRRRRQ
jgi:hypothetical protein